MIDGMEIAVAAPKGLGTARMDLMAMMTATAPSMLDAFGRLPDKITPVVRAPDPMWRGHLRPDSMWLHADRPLMSNRVLDLMHETIHMVHSHPWRGGG